MNKNYCVKQYKYQRIAEDIKVDIFSSHVKGNTPLPSIREYAKKYCANPNTISSALKLLKDEGIIYSHRTNGYFVVEIIEDKRKELAKKEICNLLNILCEIGIDKQALLNYLSIQQFCRLIDTEKTTKGSDNIGE